LWAAAPARPATSPLLISLTVMLGMIMAIVDGTIVNVGWLRRSSASARWSVPHSDRCTAMRGATEM